MIWRFFRWLDERARRRQVDRDVISSWRGILALEDAGLYHDAASAAAARARWPGYLPQVGDSRLVRMRRQESHLRLVKSDRDRAVL